MQDQTSVEKLWTKVCDSPVTGTQHTTGTTTPSGPIQALYEQVKRANQYSLTTSRRALRNYEQKSCTPPTWEVFNCPGDLTAVMDQSVGGIGKILKRSSSIWQHSTLFCQLHVFLLDLTSGIHKAQLTWTHLVPLRVGLRAPPLLGQSRHFGWTPKAQVRHSQFPCGTFRIP